MSSFNYTKIMEDPLKLLNPSNQKKDDESDSSGLEPSTSSVKQFSNAKNLAMPLDKNYKNALSNEASIDYDIDSEEQKDVGFIPPALNDEPVKSRNLDNQSNAVSNQKTPSNQSSSNETLAIKSDLEKYADISNAGLVKEPFTPEELEIPPKLDISTLYGDGDTDWVVSYINQLDKEDKKKLQEQWDKVGEKDLVSNLSMSVVLNMLTALVGMPGFGEILILAGRTIMDGLALRSGIRKFNEGMAPTADPNGVYASTKSITRINNQVNTKAAVLAKIDKNTRIAELLRLKYVRNMVGALDCLKNQKKYQHLEKAIDDDTVNTLNLEKMKASPAYQQNLTIPFSTKESMDLVTKIGLEGVKNALQMYDVNDITDPNFKNLIQSILNATDEDEFKDIIQDASQQLGPDYSKYHNMNEALLALIPYDVLKSKLLGDVHNTVKEQFEKDGPHKKLIQSLSVTDKKILITGGVDKVTFNEKEVSDVRECYKMISEILENIRSNSNISLDELKECKQSIADLKERISSITDTAERRASGFSVPDKYFLSNGLESNFIHESAHFVHKNQKSNDVVNRISRNINNTLEQVARSAVQHKVQTPEQTVQALLGIMSDQLNDENHFTMSNEDKKRFKESKAFRSNKRTMKRAEIREALKNAQGEEKLKLEKILNDIDAADLKDIMLDILSTKSEYIDEKGRKSLIHLNQLSHNHSMQLLFIKNNTDLILSIIRTKLKTLGIKDDNVNNLLDKYCGNFDHLNVKKLPPDVFGLMGNLVFSPKVYYPSDEHLEESYARLFQNYDKIRDVCNKQGWNDLSNLVEQGLTCAAQEMLHETIKNQGTANNKFRNDFQQYSDHNHNHSNQPVHHCNHNHSAHVENIVPKQIPYKAPQPVAMKKTAQVGGFGI